MRKLIRVSYGRKDTPKADREYRIDGKGPVGNLDEISLAFPDEQFLIIDPINPGDYCDKCGTEMLYDDSGDLIDDSKPFSYCPSCIEK